MPQIKIHLDGCEDVWIELQLDDQESLIVGAVYRHPNDNKNGFKMFEEAFVKVMKSFKANQKFAVEEDFNPNHDIINSSQTISNCANHTDSVECSQLVDKPTRINQIFGTGTIFDHIHIDSTLINYVLPIIIQDDISDHMPICAEFRCKPNKKFTKRPLTQKLTIEGVDLFLANLSNMLISQELHHKPSVETLMSFMSELANHYFPLKKMSRRQYKISKNPWITRSILTFINNKNKLRAKYLKNKSIAGRLFKNKNTRFTDKFWDKITYSAQYQTFFVTKMAVERVFLFLNKGRVKYCGSFV